MAQVAAARQRVGGLCRYTPIIRVISASVAYLLCVQALLSISILRDLQESSPFEGPVPLLAYIRILHSTEPVG